MSLRLPTRIAALWLAVLFLLSQGGDALGTHPCPLHDGAAGGAVAAATGHAAHHVAAGSHGAPDGGAEHGSCTCMGDCCASAGVASAPDAAVSWRPVFTTAPAPSLEAKLQVRSLRRPFLLPYSQAPPLVG